MKIRNFRGDEKRKFAGNFKTAVRSCKFWAREARRKFWNVNLHYSKKQIKNTGLKCSQISFDHIINVFLGFLFVRRQDFTLTNELMLERKIK